MKTVGNFNEHAHSVVSCVVKRKTNPIYQRDDKCKNKGKIQDLKRTRNEQV